MEYNSKRWQRLAGINSNKKGFIKENISPEAAQDISAYFGSNDSVDGPYNKKAKKQPLDEASEGYEALTAEEYAKKLNAGKDNYKLIEDPEYWGKWDIYTGEELAHYLAASTYRNVFKGFYGVYPPAEQYKSLSPEEIEEATDELIELESLSDE